MGAVALDVGTKEDSRFMAVPDDLFRRRTVWRRLQSVEKALERFHEATDFDNKIAAEAANYDLAAKIIKRASPDNTELALEFERRRDAALERAKQRKPLRQRQRRVRPEDNGEVR
jgi:hypothetical protein